MNKLLDIEWRLQKVAFKQVKFDWIKKCCKKVNIKLCHTGNRKLLTNNFMKVQNDIDDNDDNVECILFLIYLLVYLNFLFLFMGLKFSPDLK